MEQLAKGLKVVFPDKDALLADARELAREDLTPHDSTDLEGGKLGTISREVLATGDGQFAFRETAFEQEGFLTETTTIVNPLTQEGYVWKGREGSRQEHGVWEELSSPAVQMTLQRIESLIIEMLEQK